MTYIPHFVTLSLCVAILFVAAMNAVNTIKYTRRDLFQLFILMAIGWQVSTIVFFIYNQSVWVIKNHSELVGSASAVAWIIYDYSNKFFHLSCGLILFYYLGVRAQNTKINASEKEKRERHHYCPLIQTPELDKAKQLLQSMNMKYCEVEKRNAQKDAKK